MEKATFAGGCFWCTEAIFKNLKGVSQALVGYSGGELAYPSYEAVSSGNTGHAETIQITFDPKIISYENLVEIFFGTHDPTTKNRQEPDIGSQYRSMIFYKDEGQKIKAEKEKAKTQKLYDSPIVTEIVPFKNFYPAEDYHQDYYSKKTKNALYCKLIINPKIKKLQKKFEKFLK